VRFRVQEVPLYLKSRVVEFAPFTGGFGHVANKIVLATWPKIRFLYEHDYTLHDV